MVNCFSMLAFADNFDQSINCLTELNKIGTQESGVYLFPASRSPADKVDFLIFRGTRSGVEGLYLATGKMLHFKPMPKSSDRNPKNVPIKIDVAGLPTTYFDYQTYFRDGTSEVVGDGMNSTSILGKSISVGDSSRYDKFGSNESLSDESRKQLFAHLISSVARSTYDFEGQKIAHDSYKKANPGSKVFPKEPNKEDFKKALELCKGAAQEITDTSQRSYLFATIDSQLKNFGQSSDHSISESTTSHSSSSAK